MGLGHRHLFHTWAPHISKVGPCMKQVPVDWAEAIKACPYKENMTLYCTRNYFTVQDYHAPFRVFSSFTKHNV